VRSLQELYFNPLKYERTALMEHIRRYDREELRQYYLRQKTKGAEVFANYVVSLWEYERGVAEITSYPWKVAIPMTDVCNAKCTFCTAPLVPDPQWLKVEEVKYFADALRYAIEIDLQGLGEPTAHPQFEAIAEEIEKLINPVARLGIITNGWLLSGRRWELLKRIHIDSIHVSINAATDATHQIAMGSKPGTLERVIKNIECIMADPDWGVYCRYIKVSLVVTRHSLPEVSQFIETFANRGIKFFQINALLPLERPDWGFGHTDQYLDLWPGHLPNARELVAEAQRTISRYREEGIVFFTSPEHWLDSLDQWRKPQLVQLQDSPSADDSLRIVQVAAAPDFATNEVSRDSKPAAPSGVLGNGDRDPRLKTRPRIPDDRATGFWARLLGGKLHRHNGEGVARAADPGTPVSSTTLAPKNKIEAEIAAKKSGRIFCPMVYSTLSVFQHDLNVSTCCYMQHPPGHHQPSLREKNLLEAMNDPGFKLVRRTLHRDHLAICNACGYGTCRS
jgi:pyruvate-formate lyase-activating enzyme